MENLDYITYAFYNKEGHRLTIAAKVVGNSMEIAVFPCSKREPFIKKEGMSMTAAILEFESKYPSANLRDYFEITNYEIHHLESTLRIDFIKWCEEEYYKKIEFVMMLPFSINPIDVKILKGKNGVNNAIQCQSFVKVNYNRNGQ